MNSGRGCRAVNPSVCSAYDETSKRARADGRAGRGENDETGTRKSRHRGTPGVRRTRRVTGSMLPVCSSEASTLYEVSVTLLQLERNEIFKSVDRRSKAIVMPTFNCSSSWQAGDRYKGIDAIARWLASITDDCNIKTRKKISAIFEHNFATPNLLDTMS